MESFGDRLKSLRNEKELSQEELKNMLGLQSRSTVTTWEKNNGYPTCEMLMKLADIFDCSTDYVLARVNFRKHKILVDNEMSFLSPDVLEAMKIAGITVSTDNLNEQAKEEIEREVKAILQKYGLRYD